LEESYKAKFPKSREDWLRSEKGKKLEIFCYWWARERNSAAPASVSPPLNGGDVTDVAAAIVLDLVALNRCALAETDKAAA
jgi:hypothetical protein